MGSETNRWTGFLIVNNAETGFLVSCEESLRLAETGFLVTDDQSHYSIMETHTFSSRLLLLHSLDFSCGVLFCNYSLFIDSFSAELFGVVAGRRSLTSP